MAATEHVAVLFTDLVSSTEITAAVGPSLADELRRAHFAALRRAVAKSGGNEVKNLGDGLMVVFATASAALARSVAMQQEVDAENRRRDQRFGPAQDRCRAADDDHAVLDHGGAGRAPGPLRRPDTRLHRGRGRPPAAGGLAQASGRLPSARPAWLRFVYMI